MSFTHNSLPIPYQQYNAKMRKFPERLMKYLRKFGPSAFVTTLHAINSGILKMARVSMVPEDGFVYRGLNGLDLPRDLISPNAFGTRSGVESGFCSTSTNRAVALQVRFGTDLFVCSQQAGGLASEFFCAFQTFKREFPNNFSLDKMYRYQYSAEGKNPIVFQIRVGEVNHGAALTEISQFPGEEEVPETHLRAIGKHRVCVYIFLTTYEHPAVRFCFRHYAIWSSRAILLSVGTTAYPSQCCKWEFLSTSKLAQSTN